LEFWGSKESIINARNSAIVELSNFLALNNIQHWNRAVGRILDTGPSELHFLFFLKQIIEYKNSNANFDVNVEICLSKLRLDHFQIFCFVICGISFNRIKDIIFCPPLLSILNIMIPQTIQLNNLKIINLSWSKIEIIFKSFFVSSQSADSKDLNQIREKTVFLDHFFLFCDGVNILKLSLENDKIVFWFE
jgi:hypothetical protein